MLTVRLLGEQTVRGEAGQPGLRSTRAVVLLALLVLQAGVAQQRSALAATLWPDSTDAQALTNLRRELHALRALLPPGSLLAEGSGLTWCDVAGCDVDLRTFRTQAALAMAAERPDTVLHHAEAALAAYRGDLLPGRYDEWVVEARDRLRHECAGVAARLAQAARARADYPRAVEAARRRIALEPLSEPGHLALMRLQAESGDRGGAISTYHRCAALLEQQLGVDPGPPLSAELARILGSRPVPERARPASAGRTPVLVGRAQPLARLARIWQRVREDGNAHVVVLRGAAGVGKTRLATEFLHDSVRAGQATASATCFGTAGQVPLAPVADWLRCPPIRAGLSGLDPVWQREVDRLLPSSTTRVTERAERAMVDAWQRHRFMEGLARALFAARRPLALLLDNLQWCDEQTLGLCSLALALDGAPPLLLIGTLRPQLASSRLHAWLNGLGTDRLTMIELDPLGPAETADLAHAATGAAPDPGYLAQLQSATGGYPLHVIEALRAGTITDAHGWAEVVRFRLDQLSPAARDIAGLAAAVGRDFALDLLTEASDLDATGVARAVDELWRQRMLVQGGLGYDFTHDLLRDACYEAISPPRRWLLHRRLAQALELLHADAPEEVAVQLGEQYQRGGEAARALGYFRLGADAAAARFAHSDTLRLSGRALDLVATLPAGPARDRTELEVLRAMAAPLTAHRGYSSPELRRILERVVALSEQSGDDLGLVSGLVGLWAARYVQGKVEISDELARRALAVEISQPHLVAQARFAAAGSAVTLGRIEEALELFGGAVADGGGDESLIVGTRADVHALGWRAHALYLAGQRGEAAAARDESLRRARSSSHPYSLAVSLAYAAVTDQLLGDRAALRGRVSELSELTRRHGFAYYGEWGRVLHGWLVGGAAGLRQARLGVAALRGQDAQVRMPYWLALLAELHLRQGETAVARALLDAAMITARAHGDLWWLPEVQRLAAGLARDHAAARGLLAAGRALAERQGSRALAERYER